LGTDVSTVYLDIAPSAIETKETLDAGSIYLDLIAATAHECVTALRPVFQSAALNMYESIATQQYFMEVTNTYVGELVSEEAALPVVC
jgi:hypothetical protein